MIVRVSLEFNDCTIGIWRKGRVLTSGKKVMRILEAPVPFILVADGFSVPEGQ